MNLRVATRNSPLARWQTDYVIELLQAAEPDLVVEVVGLETSADQRLDLTISELGGKGAFCKQVQAEVLDARADIAVHSAKDLQAVTPEGLIIAAYPERGEPRDALVGSRLVELPEGATVATGSQRRRVQLAEARPDLSFAELRGNIATRLSRLPEFDAIVVAAAALERLALTPEVVDVLSPELMLPQVGQGALAVECRAGDADTVALLSRIDHARTRVIVSAERDFLIELGGDCDLPAGAHARLTDQVVSVIGLLADDDGRIHRAAVNGSADDHPGRAVAQRLRTRLG